MIVLVIAAVACRPVPIGGASATFGNDVVTCPQFHASSAPGCLDQPMVWASIGGPYGQGEVTGDPFSAKCALGTVVIGGGDCRNGPYAGGATNPLYDPTGYEYAIDVGAGDVGHPLTFEVWDPGIFQRSVDTTRGTRTTIVAMVAGSPVLDLDGGGIFTNEEVGETISGPGIPSGAVIVSYQAKNRVVLDRPVTSTGTGRVVTISVTPDCLTTVAPFGTPFAPGAVSASNCQTGDAFGRFDSSPIQIQVFDDDGDDLAVRYDAPLPGCHLFVLPGSDAGQFKNRWTTVCTFTPARAGIHPVRVKSSAITLPDGTAVADVGGSANGYALRVQGASATRLYALDRMAVRTNTQGGARPYLAELTSADAGKRLVVDLFDIEGAGAMSTLQVLGPPSGAPNRAPTTGAVVPAPDLADGCRYNPVVSPVQGIDLRGSAGAPAPTCVVDLRAGGMPTYGDGWLRIEIDIAESYRCDSDCWWTMRLVTPTDARLQDTSVWSVMVLDLPDEAVATGVPAS